MDKERAFALCSLVCMILKWPEAEVIVYFGIISRAPSSVDAEREELRARSYTAKTIYTSVYQRYPFITVGINQQSLKPSDEFQSAITDALAQAGDDMKTSALDRVFSIYGHVFQIEFDLGALMVKTSSTQTSSRVRMLIVGPRSSQF